MSKELFLSRVGNQIWAALAGAGEVVELRVEEDSPGRARVGQIYKARVSNVVPALDSAFVDLGLERDAFIHGSDLPTGSEPDARPIELRLRVGQELLVQVVREARGSKGCRVSCHVGLAGRALVLLPFSTKSRVSRRITDPEERERLDAVLSALPRGSGYVARTAAEGFEAPVLREEAARLAEAWSQLRRDETTAACPACLYDELDPLLRLLRDRAHEDLARIVVESPADRSRAVAYLEQFDPALAARVEPATNGRSLFEAQGVGRGIATALKPRVGLKDGSYLVIEQTEALVAIDVNSGRATGGTNPQESHFRINQQAALEIARQVRLRDLGGIIVIDFIDMEREDDTRSLLETLEQALVEDPARTRLFGMTELGLVQLTRMRTREGPARAMTRRCSSCRGRGRIKRSAIVAAEALAAVRVRARTLADDAITVAADAAVIEALRGMLTVEETGAIALVEQDGMPPDEFDLR